MKKAVFLVLALLVWAGFSAAGDGHGDDHDRARQALEAGEVLPLRTIIDSVERDYPGQIVEVELEREDGRWEYEIKVLRAGGALVKIKVDARDGSVLRVKGKKGGEKSGDKGGEQAERERRGDERKGGNH